MDETALAIARQAEENKTAKANKPGRLVPDQLNQNRALTRDDISPQRPGGIAPSTSTKRPKTFG